VEDTHDTDVAPALAGSMRTGADQDVPSQRTALPPTARQNADDTQDTEERLPDGSRRTGADQTVPSH